MILMIHYTIYLDSKQREGEGDFDIYTLFELKKLLTCVLNSRWSYKPSRSDEAW